MTIAPKDIVPKWLIQEDVFNEDFTDLYEALKTTNTPYQVIKYVPFSDELNTNFKDEDCVIVYGSLNLAKLVQRTKKWVPGAWCNLQNFRCSTYYAYYGRHLLNQDYIMLPVLELMRKEQEIFERLYYDIEDCTGLDSLFMRPDRGDKPFAGGVFERKYLKKDLQNIIDAQSPELLVVVAPNIDVKPYNIQREYRFVVSQNEIIAGTIYMESGELKPQKIEKPECYPFLRNFVNQKWSPDPIFCVDVCKWDGIQYLLEINSFSCSGFYACDKLAIVNAANKLAIQEYQDIFG